MAVYKIILIVGCVVAIVASYFIYHNLHNPVTLVVDEISEELLGVDLEPIYDKLDPSHAPSLIKT